MMKVDHALLLVRKENCATPSIRGAALVVISLIHSAWSLIENVIDALHLPEVIRQT